MSLNKIGRKTLSTYHAIYWILFICLFTLLWGTYDNNYYRNFMVQFFSLPSRLALVYMTILVLFPLFFNKGKIFLFALCYILLLVGFTVLIQRPMMLYYIEGRYLDYNSTEFFNVIELTNTMLDVNIAAIIPVGSKLVGYWLNSRKRLDELQILNQKLSNYQNQYVLFKKGSSKHKVFLNDIFFLESMKNNIKVTTRNKELVFYGSISNLEQILRDQPFIRIHRSFIVNINYVESFTSSIVTINGSELPIGRKYKDETLKKLKR